MTNEVLDELDSILSPKRPPTKKRKMMESFMDRIDPLNIAEIHEALFEFLIAANVDFKAVECTYLKKLISLLRPAYNLPLATDIPGILDKVYDHRINGNSKSFMHWNSMGVLLINYEESTDELISMTFDNEGKMLFVSTCSSRSVDITKFTEESMSIVKQKCNTAVYAVVSNARETPIITSPKYWYFSCTHQNVRKLINNVVGDELVHEVNMLHDAFEEPLQKVGRKSMRLESEDNIETYCEALSACKNNLYCMKQVLGDGNFDHQAIALLFSNSFERKLNEIFPIVK